MGTQYALSFKTHLDKQVEVFGKTFKIRYFTRLNIIIVIYEYF